MQPRKSPVRVLIETKQAALALRSSEGFSGAAITSPAVTKVSMTLRARAGSSAPLDGSVLAVLLKSPATAGGSDMDPADPGGTAYACAHVARSPSAPPALPHSS